MENIGVAVGIIIDGEEENIEEVIMSDDGTGGGIRIPSILIGKTDGKKLLDFLRLASEEELKQVAVMADFYLEKPDDRVEYDFWFTSSNDKALDFIEDFQSTDAILGE